MLNGSKSTLPHVIPNNKVHGTKMGPTWVLSAPDRPHVGPMNLAIRDGLLPDGFNRWWLVAFMPIPELIMTCHQRCPVTFWEVSCKQFQKNCSWTFICNMCLKIELEKHHFILQWQDLILISAITTQYAMTFHKLHVQYWICLTLDFVPSASVPLKYFSSVLKHE